MAVLFGIELIITRPDSGQAGRFNTIAWLRLKNPMTKMKTKLHFLASVSILVGGAIAPCHATEEVFHDGFELSACSEGGIPEPGDPSLTEEEICCWASTGLIPGFLDGYQSPGDGRVIFCHATGPGQYDYLDVATNLCIPHIDHPSDLFPSTICDS